MNNLNEQVDRMKKLMGLSKPINENLANVGYEKPSGKYEELTAEINKALVGLKGQKLFNGIFNGVRGFEVNGFGNGEVDIVVRYGMRSEIWYNLGKRQWDLQGQQPNEHDTEMLKRIEQAILQEISMVPDLKNVGQSSEEGEVNEISDETMVSAFKKSADSGQETRKNKFNDHMFKEFVGADFLGGKISDIKFEHGTNPENPEDEFNFILVGVNTPDGNGLTVQYEVDSDEWVRVPEQITRRDGRILTLIAKKVNPQTKYGQNVTGHFNISGIHEDEAMGEDNLFEDDDYDDDMGYTPKQLASAKNKLAKKVELFNTMLSQLVDSDGDKISIDDNYYEPMQFDGDVLVIKYRDWRGREQSETITGDQLIHSELFPLSASYSEVNGLIGQAKRAIKKSGSEVAFVPVSMIHAGDNGFQELMSQVATNKDGVADTLVKMENNTSQSSFSKEDLKDNFDLVKGFFVLGNTYYLAFNKETLALFKVVNKRDYLSNNS